MMITQFGYHAHLWNTTTTGVRFGYQPYGALPVGGSHPHEQSREQQQNIAVKHDAKFFNILDIKLLFSDILLCLTKDQ